MKPLIAFTSLILVATPLAAQQRSDADRPAAKEERSETRQDMSDAGLTGKVKSALAADVGLKTLTNIDVDSDKGVVTLKGHVDSDDNKRRAEAVAKKVDGVSKVKNQLSVRKPKS